MTVSNISSIQQSDEIKPLFKTFQWNRKEIVDENGSCSAYANLNGKLRDITSGCATILELIEFDDI